MLYREIMADCSQIHTKHINAKCEQNAGFIGAFAKSEKRCHTRPYAWYCSAPTGREFHEIWYSILEACRENSSLFKSDKINEWFTWRTTYIYKYLAQLFLKYKIF
jgi:hypothetical protein